MVGAGMPMPMAHTVVAVVPVPGLVAAVPVGVARAIVLAVGVRIELRAIAGVGYDFLRRSGGSKNSRSERGSDDS